MVRRRLRVRTLPDEFSDDIPMSHITPKPHSFSGFYVDNLGSLIAIGRVYQHSNHTAELADVYIDEKYRGKHAEDGKKWSHILMRGLLNASKRRGFRNLWLWVTSDNIAAIRLYTRFGFTIDSNDLCKKHENAIRTRFSWLRDKDITFMRKRHTL